MFATLRSRRRSTVSGSSSRVTAARNGTTTCPCTKSSSVRLGRPIWRQMTWQLSAWSHSVFEDATRAVSPAPGTVTGVHWLPRGNYQFKVRAFGQGSAPAVEQYILTFHEEASVSMAPTSRWYQLGA